MPVIPIDTTVGAGATVNNALSGSQYEFLPFPAYIEVGLVAAATGITATVQSGADVMQEEGPVNVRAANTLPVYPEDFYLADVAAAGDRLKIGLRSSAGAGVRVLGQVRITPL